MFFIWLSELFLTGNYLHLSGHQVMPINEKSSYKAVLNEACKSLVFAYQAVFV